MPMRTSTMHLYEKSTVLTVYEADKRVQRAGVRPQRALYCWPSLGSVADNGVLPGCYGLWLGEALTLAVLLWAADRT
eukprot:scaffold629015_cov14-Prasinocladus_malaysianus.AAC.1